ncbi:hypothetical protein TWF506_004012 [Arthrobotrys conoides]|uniref:Uncharacterized protein n=1 Tax=Arthrobotrys conoides TaxID=74498 RepID=A0AAN8N723_9PEZI
MAAVSETPKANTPPPPPSLSRAAGLVLKSNIIPTPSKSIASPTSFLDLLPPPRKPHTPKLQSPSRLRYVMTADSPLDIFSKPEEPTKKFVIERKTSAAALAAATFADTTTTTIGSIPHSPIQYQGTYHGPYFSRIRRFQGPRKPGVYEKIHDEWIRKALLRQERDLKWDPETGEPLFDVRGGEE